MKLGNFLEPENMREDKVHQHYRRDEEIAKSMSSTEKDSSSESSSWLEKLAFWK